MRSYGYRAFEVTRISHDLFIFAFGSSLHSILSLKMLKMFVLRNYVNDFQFKYINGMRQLISRVTEMFRSYFVTVNAVQLQPVLKNTVLYLRSSINRMMHYDSTKPIQLS